MNNRCTSCGVLIDDNETRCIRCNNSQFISGQKLYIKPLFYIFDGLIILVKNKKLLKLSLLPLVITTVLLIFTYIFAVNLMVSGLNTYLPVEGTVNTFKELSSYGLAFIGSITLIVFSLFMFLPVSSLICIPFNDSISIETEKIILGEDTLSSGGNLINEVKVTIVEVFKLLFLKIVLLAISLPVLIIPVIGQISFFFILALITSIDFLDIIMARKKYTLSEKISFLNKNSFAFILFSIPVMLLFWVPLVQILIIPAAAIGGTKLFLEANKN